MVKFIKYDNETEKIERSEIEEDLSNIYILQNVMVTCTDMLSKDLYVDLLSAYKMYKSINKSQSLNINEYYNISNGLIDDMIEKDLIHISEEDLEMDIIHISSLILSVSEHILKIINKMRPGFKIDIKSVINEKMILQKIIKDELDFIYNKSIKVIS